MTQAPTPASTAPAGSAERLTFGPGKRSLWQAMRRGFFRRCPNCGEGRMLRGYVAVNAACDHCGQPIEPYRADDAPAYFTIFVVGHIIVPLVLWLENLAQPAMWVHAAIWIPATLVLTLALLPPIKGAVMGLQWALDLRPYDQA